MLSIVVLIVFVAAAAVLWQFGGTLLDAQRRRLAAGGLAGAGLVLAIVFAFVGGERAATVALDVTVAENQGAVSYSFLIEQPGDQLLQIWPQPPRDGQVLGPLVLRLLLSAPGNTDLMNETVSVPTAEIESERDGKKVLTLSWSAWSHSFSAPQEGIYQIALGLPPRAPQLQLRVSEAP